MSPLSPVRDAELKARRGSGKRVVEWAQQSWMNFSPGVSPGVSPEAGANSSTNPKNRKYQNLFNVPMTKTHLSFGLCEYLVWAQNQVDVFGGQGLNKWRELLFSPRKFSSYFFDRQQLKIPTHNYFTISWLFVPRNFKTNFRVSQFQKSNQNLGPWPPPPAAPCISYSETQNHHIHFSPAPQQTLRTKKLSFLVHPDKFQNEFWRKY